MKSFIASSMVLASFQAFAFPVTTTIEFELTAETYTASSKKEFSLASLNKKLKAAGVKEFPKTQAFGMDSQKTWDGLMKQVKAANKALKMELHPIFEKGYFYEFPTMCYRGEAEDVQYVIRAMMENVLHGDQNIDGIRARDSKWIHWMSEFFETNEEMREAQMDNGNEVEMKMWDEYDIKSQTVLVISGYGPQGDGTEMTATEIKPCK